MNMRISISISALLLLGVSYGCDSDSGGASTPGLSLKLYGPADAADPFVGVGWMRLTLTGDGLEAPVVQLQRYSPGGSANLDAIPYSLPGEKRSLVVEGLSDAGGEPGFVISRGRSPAVEVAEGSPLQQFEVLFARVNSFLPPISATSRVSQQLANGRVGHAVTRTPRELVITGGGTIPNASAAWWANGLTSVSASVEAFDLNTREVGPRNPLLLPRTWHTGTSLSSGQVIIAGGISSDGNPTSSVELYSPPGVLDGRAMNLPPLAVARAGHTATLIDEANRVILFIGGDAQGTWEIWDPVAGSSTTGGAKPLPDNLARRHHQATTFFLPGRVEPAVLVTGGETNNTVHASAMLYDSVAKALVGLPTGQAMPGGARVQHSAVYVPARNFIYVIGGFGDTSRRTVSAGIDVFDIGQTRFIEGQAGFRMRAPRGGQQAVLLEDNLVAIVGGFGEEPPAQGLRPLSSLEVIYEYIDTQSQTLRIEIASSWTPNGIGQVPFMATERIGHQVVAVDGMALIIGGAAVDATSGGFRLIRDLTLYNPQ
jgi:hypothetical protein